MIDVKLSSVKKAQSFCHNLLLDLSVLSKDLIWYRETSELPKFRLTDKEQEITKKISQRIFETSRKLNEEIIIWIALQNKEK